MQQEPNITFELGPTLLEVDNYNELPWQSVRSIKPIIILGKDPFGKDLFELSFQFNAIDSSGKERCWNIVIASYDKFYLGNSLIRLEVYPAIQSILPFLSEPLRDNLINLLEKVKDDIKQLTYKRIQRDGLKRSIAPGIVFAVSTTVDIVFKVNNLFLTLVELFSLTILLDHFIKTLLLESLYLESIFYIKGYRLIPKILNKIVSTVMEIGEFLAPFSMLARLAFSICALSSIFKLVGH